MKDEHFEVLTHTLGMTTSSYRRKLSWWLDNENHRNHYATAEDCDGYSTIIELVELGWMKRGRDIPGGLTYYHATDAGVTLVRGEFFERRKGGRI